MLHPREAPPQPSIVGASRWGRAAAYVTGCAWLGAACGSLTPEDPVALAGSEHPEAVHLQVEGWSSAGLTIYPGAAKTVHLPADSGTFEAWAAAQDASKPVTLTARWPDGHTDIQSLSPMVPSWLALAARGPTVTFTADGPVALGAPTWVPADHEGGLVVVIFIDTLRADRVGAWGYGRPTTPAIDRLAAAGRRFEHTVSPAPWTLPSARALLSGRQPEAWRDGELLQQALGDAGWFTAAVVANPWLGAPHGLNQGWGWHQLNPGAAADVQVDDALSLLAVPTRRDRFLLVHLQDPHLPYREPAPFRSRWAGDPPPGLDGAFTGRELRALPPLDPADPRRTYVSDRYDQNVAWTDSQVGRLLDAVPASATVVVLADHGEELWDHRGVEHGHALWEELVEVPLVIRSPQLLTGVERGPTTLLDVAPTIRALHGVAPDPTAAGIDLRLSPPADRVLVTGRLLYGASAWAVVADGITTQSRAGAVHVADAPATPAQRDVFASRLSDRLSLPVRNALRIARPGVAHATSSSPASSVSIACPGGFSAWWSEPRPLVERTPPRADGDRLVIDRNRGTAPTGELFAMAADSDATCTLTVNDPATGLHTGDIAASPLLDAAPVRVGPRGREATADGALMPHLQPTDDSAATESLRALGYLAPD